MENEIAACPLTGYEIKPVPQMDAAIMDFQFLVSPMSQDRHQTPTLLIHTAELRLLAQRIFEVVAVLEKIGAHSPIGPKH